MVAFSLVVTSIVSERLERRLYDSGIGQVEMRTPDPPAPPYTLPGLMLVKLPLLRDPPGEVWKLLRLVKKHAMVVESLPVVVLGERD